MSDFPIDSAPESGQIPPAELVIERGPSPDKRFQITAVANTIGRSPNNTIVINDPEISRRHAQVLQQDAGFAVEDLGSTNGTFVNGQRCVGVTAVSDGDIIELGDTVRLRFVLSGAAQITEDDEDTADMLPVRPPAQPAAAAGQAASSQPLYVAPSVETYPVEDRSNRMIIGCVSGVILVICLCMLLVLFLESYNQGQYLYCGWLRPFWQVVLGPFGFNPICP